MRGRSSAGKQSGDTLRKSKVVASQVIWLAGHGNARRCFIGPMTAAKSDSEACRVVIPGRELSERTMVRNCAPENLEIPGLVLSLSSGRALRGPVGTIPE